MKAIFLGVNGVINSYRHSEFVYNLIDSPAPYYSYPFDDESLSLLEELVYNTDSYIIITSSRRLNIENYTELLKILKEYNLDNRVIGVTPYLSDKEEEINYMINQIHIDDYIVIDTDNLKMNFLVKTNRHQGLTYEQCIQAKKLLLK